MFGRDHERSISRKSLGKQGSYGGMLVGVRSALPDTGWSPGSVSIDVGWRNIVFSLRTAAAAILALALAYWLDLSSPQWATLTVYILAQPTVGASLAKGAWRACGTVAGGLTGLVLVALFSQAAELLVAATVLLVGLSFYAGARLRNYVSHGALLAGYTTLLVAYEGSAHPLGAWSIAVDRITEILIGIACGTLASAVILPRYAGDALRQAQANTFSGLAHYVTTALRLSSPSGVFAQLRRRMVREVVSFDALCSSALFEAPEMRVNEGLLRRTVSEFLVALSIARGLFVRLGEFDNEEARAIGQRLRPTLEAIAAQLEPGAADRTPWDDPHRLRREILAARIALRKATVEIQSMAGKAPFDPLAAALLILRRVGDLLHSLSMVVVTGAASLGTQPGNRHTPSRRRPGRRRDPEGQREALLGAIRAGVAVLLLSCLWIATGWNEGFTAVSGGAIMLFFGVNQDDPQAGARSYLVWSIVGILVAYAMIALVLPFLQGFGALSLVLLLVLLPAGLMAGTPSHAWAGIALGAWTVAEIGFGNVFKPDELAYVNNAAALILGMLVSLAAIVTMPVTSRARRWQSWQLAIGTILPGVARGQTVPRRGAGAIVASLAALLPRLALDRERDETFFRGTLSMASLAVELGRLRDVASVPDLPSIVADAIDRFLARFAVALEQLTDSRVDRRACLAEAEALVAGMRAELSAQSLEAGATGRSVLRAAASLRFVADRFEIDRGYLEHDFAED
jgi:uncharacterized membrane protein YccC